MSRKNMDWYRRRSERLRTRGRASEKKLYEAKEDAQPRSGVRTISGGLPSLGKRR
jgi:hypothetical protein